MGESNNATRAPRQLGYWAVYRWTALALWLVLLVLLVPDALFTRGNYYNASAPLFENALMFLTLGVGATLISSLLLSLVWAFAIWRILRIGGATK